MLDSVPNSYKKIQIDPSNPKNKPKEITQNLVGIKYKPEIILRTQNTYPTSHIRRLAANGGGEWPEANGNGRQTTGGEWPTTRGQLHAAGALTTMNE